MTHSTPVTLTRRFATNLRLLREAKGLTKSDLARELFGTETTKEGYQVARNRDRIGVWEAEKAVPRSDAIRQIAEYFKVDFADLAPDIAGASASRQPGAVSLRFLEGDPGRAHLHLDLLLPAEVAAQIVQLVSTATFADDDKKKKPGKATKGDAE